MAMCGLFIQARSLVVRGSTVGRCIVYSSIVYSSIACESILYTKAWSLVTGERSVVLAARLLPVGRSSYTGVWIHLHLHRCVDTVGSSYTGVSSQMVLHSEDPLSIVWIIHNKLTI